MTIPEASLRQSLGAREAVRIDGSFAVPRTVALRLLANLRINGDCWEWTGYRKSKRGHGCTESSGTPVYVHRLAFAIFNGPIPAGVTVCHRCDNPICWRPEHLFAGTQADNVADMNAKGRGVPPPVHFGEAHPQATLTDEQVAAIRAASGVTQRALAKRYGVSQSTIWRIRRGVTR